MKASQSDFQPLVSVSQNEDVLINLNEKVGTWTYGDYFKGVSKKTGQEKMVKMVDIDKFPLKKKCLEQEISILKKLSSCPYVVKFMEYKYYQKTLVIITESYNGGDLKTYLKKNGPLPEEQAVRLLMQLVCGVKALQQLKYTHAAVRPENILLHNQEGVLTLKLSNFIFARQHGGDNKATFPLPFDSMYLAPEVLKDEVYCPQSDIWSIGVIFYEMLFGSLPWEGKTIEELRDNIINKNLNLQPPEGVSDTSMEFIHKCLQRDVKKRLDWNNIVEHRLLFRAMFMNDDGTYKLYNDEFKECSPSKRNLMFGIRQAGGSVPGTPKKKNTTDASFQSENPKFLSAKKTLDLNTSSFSIQSNTKSPSPFNVKTTAMTPKSDLKNRSPSPIHADKSDEVLSPKTKDRPTSPDRLLADETLNKSEAALIFESPPKKPDPEFYSHLLAKVGDSDDYYLSKYMNREPLDNKGPFSKKTFVKPYKWLANKAEIVSEIYELALKNRQHCCYEKIVNLLNEETNHWSTLNLVTMMQKQFLESVESTFKKEEDKHMAWPKHLKTNHSLTKKEKSHQIEKVIEEIVASLTNNNENTKANNEEMIQIAANFKILREYDEIGDSVMKELDVMKNSLIVFYRKKDHTHIRYILLVRNLV